MKPPYEQMVIARDFSIRRSELTCPAHSLKMMTRAAGSTADEVIFDLEDACAVSQKVEARRTLIEAFRTLDFQGKVRAFRPNSVRTRYCYRDIVEVVEEAGAFVDSVVIPKVDGPEDIHFVDTLLNQVEQNAGLSVGRIRIEALIESARGVLRAEEIALSSPRIAALIFGVADYAGDVGARDFSQDDGRTFLFARSKLIAAARSAEIDAIDSVTVQFRDLERVRQDAEAGARLGFDGKWAIHPSHIDVLHRVYTPTREELERALAILDAYARADKEGGQGAIVFEDQMVDAASLRVEWKKIAMARKAGLIDAENQLVKP
jgi:citrate lyase subunit beta / citryl-CoA lyase